VGSAAKVQMPSATSVVARSYPDHVIGVENQLPWHLGTDLRQFRRRTEFHAVIMGRKTFESIGRALPRRYNIVLSRSPLDSDSGVVWADSVETALYLADVYSICNFKTQFFVIGGENIYGSFHRYINKVCLTEVFARINGDAKFDLEFNKEEWRSYKEVDYPKSDNDDYPFRVTTLLRKKPEHRYRMRDEFRKTDPAVAGFLDRYENVVSTTPLFVEKEEQLLLL
jgi:dihydrofolate reductase